MARDAIAVALLGVLWALVNRLVGSAGEVPLNDDWAYAHTVRALLERGVFDPLAWTPAISLTHALWGALFCLPEGFSYAALRAAIQVAGLVGVGAVWALAREMGAGFALGLLCAATVALDPIYLGLAQTFMTDVSFFACFAVALLGFARDLRAPSRTAWAIGTAAGLAATLNRQNGLVVAAAFLVASLGTRRGRSAPLRAALPVLVGVAALVAWEAWTRMAGLPGFDNEKLGLLRASLGRPVATVFAAIGFNALVVALYVGLLALPALLATAWFDRRFAAAALGAAAIAGALAARGLAMPLVGNVLQATGIGPVTLRDVEILRLTPLPVLPWIVRVAVTAAAALGAILLARVAWRAVAGPPERAAGRGRSFTGGRGAGARDPAAGFLVATGVLYAAPIVLAPFFDRYLLPLLAPALGLVAASASARAAPGPWHREWARWRVTVPRSAAIAALLLFGFLSVAGVHDYLAWNRARWDLLEGLLTAGAAPEEIDGGFEFNGAQTYARDYVAPAPLSWWWVRDDRWVVAFSSIPGTEERARGTFERWLPPFGSGTIRILERVSASGDSRPVPGSAGDSAPDGGAGAMDRPNPDGDHGA